MQKVTEYIVHPFRLGNVEIDAIWIDGKPYFSEKTVKDWLEKRDYKIPVDEFFDYVPEVGNHAVEIELSNPAGTKEVLIVIDLLFLVLAAYGHNAKNAMKFKIELANFLIKHWEDIPDQEGQENQNG